jgi:hypothetical protein
LLSFRPPLKAIEDLDDVVFSVVHDYILKPWNKRHWPEFFKPETNRGTAHFARQSCFGVAKYR